MPRLIRRDFSFLGQIPPVGNSAKIRARGRGGLQLRGERIRPPPPPGRRAGAREPAGARGAPGRAGGRRGRAGGRRGARGRRGGRAGAASEKALLLMRVGPFARPRRIKNNAETTVFLILQFRPKRAKMCLRRGKKPPRRGRQTGPRESPPTATGPRPRAHQRGARTPATRPSLPAREGSLGAHYDRPFSPGARRKARKGKKRTKG